jgi:transcriptional regulator with XRE-family HTH domain
MFGFFEIRKSILNKLRKRAYRDAYVAAHVRRWIAHQIRALRDHKGWNQGQFSKQLGKPQSVVSRLEDPSYGKMTVATLLEVAKAFDVALLIKFVDYRTFLRETSDLSTPAMAVESFDYNSLAGANAAQPFVGGTFAASETAIPPTRIGEMEEVWLPSAGVIHAMSANSLPVVRHVH